MNTSTGMHEYYLSSMKSSYHEHKHTYAWILFIILDEFLSWTQAHVCMNIIYHPWGVPNMKRSTRMNEYYLSSLSSPQHEHKHTYAWILFIILGEFLTWTLAQVCMNIIYHPWRVPIRNTSTHMHEYYLSSLASSYHEHKHTYAWILFIMLGSSKHEHKHTYAWILCIILDEFLTWTQAHVCMNIIYRPWRVPNMNTNTRMHEYYLSSLTSF